MTITAPDGDGPLLRVDDLVVEFTAGRSTVQAVSGVSLEIRAGETLGLVGESGCGKSTLGRAIVQVQPPTSGSVTLDGVDLTTLSDRELRRFRTRIQMIFQDPISSLNPRRRVRDIVAEPLVIWGRGTPDERKAKVREMLVAVGIDPDAAGDRHPQEFSGGQCQRISIARALMSEPALLICDEPVSALDVSVQAQILNLLADLRQTYGLTMLFIAHDLAVVKNVSDRVAVMYLGKLAEVATSEALYRSPAHPYTEALLRSIPQPGFGHRAPGPDGRAALAHRPALGLPVPHPVPVRHRSVRRRGAAARRGLAGPPGGLPLPAGGRDRSGARPGACARTRGVPGLTPRPIRGSDGVPDPPPGPPGCVRHPSPRTARRQRRG